jgi:serine/threonine-protein kinase
MRNRRGLGFQEQAEQKPIMTPPPPPLRPAGGPAKKASRCRVALAPVSGSQFRGQIGQLLHGRLRTVTLIALAPIVLFLIRNLIEPHPRALIGPVGVGMQAFLAVFLSILAVALWRTPHFSLAALRKMELAVFGLMALYFSWRQVCTFRYAPIFEPPLCGSPGEVTRVWISHTAVRWFFLIVIYGVFIPNTGKRCAAVTGSAALAPLILTPLGALLYGRHCPEITYGVLDLAILMVTAFAVAVFGSYRFQVLHQQVFQAQQLGQYRLGARIGSGGMGEVYLGEHVLLRRPCAVKLIRPDQTRDPAVLERFEREVQAMATLTHWNTVEVYDYGRADDGSLYYVMEYLPGPNLETLVGRYGPLPPGRAIYFLRQVCRALREAHGVGLLHRDIKPSNIIACERGGVHDVAKLLDFGLVQQAGRPSSRLTLHGAVLGSPPYMAPEQAVGRPDVDARADIYSLGGVGYFLLTGQPPFARETAMEMMLAHAYEPVAPPVELQPGIPADLQEVILRCLDKKPEGRYAGAEELEKALAACADADRWTEESAAAWWRRVGGEGETAPLEVPALQTPRGV